ncbi:hypothetical protein PS662_03359 [Pseudomonas fluorescens]|nr:hypothetical protein PS662_03359 [Pseudomonas fluorescens]
MAVLDIDNEPVFRVGLSFEFLANQCPDPGACAVRTYQITGADGMHLAILIAQGGNHTVCLLEQVLELEAPQAVH